MRASKPLGDALDGAFDDAFGGRAERRLRALAALALALLAVSLLGLGLWVGRPGRGGGEGEPPTTSSSGDRTGANRPPAMTWR